MYRVLIKDRNGKNFLTVSFMELLQSIEGFDDNYFWALYELDASVISLGIPGYSILVDKVYESKSGYSISWQELQQLAQGLDQVINLILVASEQKNRFVPYSDTRGWRNRYKICIEILDGDYWEVTSLNKELVTTRPYL